MLENTLKPMYLESVKPRTISKMRVGQKLHTKDREGNGTTFTIMKVYPSIILCRNEHNQFLESFDVGDLVTLGLEPEWDEKYGFDPRGRYAD